MVELIQWDKELMIFLNNLGSEGFDSFWKYISEIWVWVPFYAMLVYLLYKRLPLNSFIFAIIFVALGVTASDQIASIFKNGIMRFRPCHDPSLDGLLREVTCGGKYGFYSAHASSTFFLASYLTFLLKDKVKMIPYILFPWAAMVAYSRIYLGVHFPLDILMGACMGFLLGGFFSTLALKVIAKQNRARNQAQP